RVVHDHGIRTVISLRDGSTAAERAEEVFCREQEITFVRLLPRLWTDGNGGVPAAANVRRFLDVMSDPANHPVLIHCFAGIHRTGSYCAIFRMDYNNWSKEQALHEMVQKGYTILKDHVDVQKYFNQYRSQPIVVRTRATVTPSLSAN